jgi:glutathione S-transferase
MLKLYSMPSSGNSYKVRLLLAKRAILFEHIAAEDGSGVTTSAEFLALAPKGKVPLVVFEDGKTLSESNAILTHFGEGSRFWPTDPLARSRMLAWMFWEQNAHETTVAVRGGILSYEKNAAKRMPEILGPLLEAGHGALAVMDEQLDRTPYLAADAISLADICLYAYTHSADDKGGFDLSRFPAIKEWLRRVEADDGHVPLDWLPGE